MTLFEYMCNEREWQSLASGLRANACKQDLDLRLSQSSKHMSDFFGDEWMPEDVTSELVRWRLMHSRASQRAIADAIVLDTLDADGALEQTAAMNWCLSGDRQSGNSRDPTSPSSATSAATAAQASRT